MDFALNSKEEALLSRLRSYLATHENTDLMRQEADHTASHEAQAFVTQLGQDGWLAGSWAGGSDSHAKTSIERWLILEELAYRQLPNGSQTIRIVAPTLASVGTVKQKSELLPRMLTGSIVVALGYTEPDAGSDLASLTTRATRQGDEYVINGHKMYITLAHIATHIWLAVRTDPAVPKHRGISILLVPVDAEGITIRPMYTQAGTRTNEIYFDDVHVSSDCLVGQENQGWEVIRSALTFERAFAGSSYGGLARHFENLLGLAQESKSGELPLLEQEIPRCALAALAVDLHVARLLSLRTAWLIDAGRIPTAESSMNKVWLSELRQRVASVGLDLMGPEGQLGAGVDDAPLRGDFDQLYQYSPVPKFAAGTNEIQRDIIAQRGLGLPRP